jgi:hypothetical protein
MNGGVPHGCGYLRIYERDHRFGALNRRAGAGDRRTQSAESVRIRRTHLNQGDIGSEWAAEHQVRNFRQKDRGVVGSTFIDGVAHVGSDEEGVVSNVPLKFRGNVGSRTFCMKRYRFNIGERWCSTRKRFEKFKRGHGGFMDIDTLM